MVTRIGKLFRREHSGSCTEVHSLSSELMDGDLDSRTADRLSGHLDICPPCTAFFNTLKETVRLLSSSKASTPIPSSTLSKVRARLKQDGVRPE